MINSDNLSKHNSTINKIIYAFIIIGLVGFIDAIYLTVKYYVGTIDCSIISGCQEVLNSTYSNIFGIPLALLGGIYYLFILIVSLSYISNQNKLAIKALSIVPSLGFIFSLWLIYLQLFIINAICIYCMLSAATSILLFILSLVLIKKNKAVPEDNQ